MNYPELTSLMKRHGCTYAMNLDGGGSSTLWLGGRIMNSPSDGQERKVANGLIVIVTE
jgi:exopolysaccharide biosynthesis protein